jgi:uncharacterized protein YlxW (UPF0749 family)
MSRSTAPSPETSHRIALDAPASSRRSGATTILFSLTSICFVFGILLAFGVRSIQAVRLNEVESREDQKIQSRQLDQMKNNLAREEQERAKLQASIKSYQDQIASGKRVSQMQAHKMNVELKKLQGLLGLTAVKGPGIVIRLSDNPNASKDAGPDAGPFLPGIVHDFDLLQVVNELRSAKAEAIAINGVRITGFTPIRCVGPTIYVNYEPKPAPFEIEAIGNADDLKNALAMPGGILENLSNQTLGVKIYKDDTLHLPAATSLGVPDLKVAKTE